MEAATAPFRPRPARGQAPPGNRTAGRQLRAARQTRSLRARGPPMHHLIPPRQTRPDKDVIFALNAEANRRRQAGEPVVNATIGALMNDDGSLAVLPSVTRTLAQVPAEEWAAYAPI